MKHLSIEGMDGVGKTSACKLVAEKLSYKFIEKPLHYLLDIKDSDWPNYFHARDIVNASQDRNFTAWFYGLSNIYLYSRFKDRNIVTDRHVVSNYCWSGSDYNGDIYDLIIKKIGFPSLTVILYSTPEAIYKRLKERDDTDSNLKDVAQSEVRYRKMIAFCKEKHIPFIVVDSSNMTIEETADEIIRRYKEICQE